MKKITTTLVSLFATAIIYAQSLDTVSLSVQLRAQDIAWLIGKYGSGSDSLDRVKVRAIRDIVRTANPQNWTTEITLNNVPGRIVLWMYNAFVTAPFGEMMAMGSTNAERITIYTRIRAINNSALQYYIGVIDANLQNNFIQSRQIGKEILIDN